MFKLCIFSIILVVAFAAPEANPSPKAKPHLVAAAYTAPVVAAPAVAYSAPIAYSAGYITPSVYSASYRAYPAYSAPLVVL